MVASRVPRSPSLASAAHGPRAERGLGSRLPTSGPAIDEDGFVPPPRFGRVGFEDYRPRHPSQAEAAARTAAFAEAAADLARPRRFRPPWRRRPVGRGLYLDGGFGVGKTHLLAAAWHAAPLPTARKRYLSFGELVHVLGASGREAGHAAFEDAALLCIDEFELDDPGNTLIVATFLAERFEAGASVLTTSNTPPASQGEGRFAAEDFRREIQGIAERFEVLRVDGPDHRAVERLAEFATPEGMDEAEATAAGPVVRTTGEELIATLEALHPIRYRRLLEGVGTLLVDDLRRIEDQATALRFVHFVDRLYDLGTRFRASAAFPLAGTFVGEWRDGAYAKKHDRCLSRLSELLREPVRTRAGGAEPGEGG